MQEGQDQPRHYAFLEARTCANRKADTVAAPLLCEARAPAVADDAGTLEGVGKLISQPLPQAIRHRRMTTVGGDDRGSSYDCDARVKESVFSGGGELREFMKKARGSGQSVSESRSVRH
jgi:hypothetical protein